MKLKLEMIKWPQYLEEKMLNSFGDWSGLDEMEPHRRNRFFKISTVNCSQICQEVQCRDW